MSNESVVLELEERPVAAPVPAPVPSTAVTPNSPAAVFLASGDAGWITGETLVVSGGLR